MDEEFHLLLRRSVQDFQNRSVRALAPNARVLDVAPHTERAVATIAPPSMHVDTLDINEHSGATYVADLCDLRDVVADATYDAVFCTEVLEHTLAPWMAAEEIHRILKPGGVAFVTTPFNFRIHGPLPDCWRFTIFGLRVLFQSFSRVEVDSLEAPDRPLMPIQYRVVARKR